MRYLVFLFLGFGFWGAAQNRSVEPVTLNFHQFTVKEKLTESTNWFVNTDSDGFTWVGSMGGANVFDGVNNQPVRDALQGLNIQSSFLEDHRGDIWFTTEQAIHRYQKEKNRFTSDFIGGTAGMHYAFYLDREQDLWVIAQGKLFKYATQDTGQNRTHEIAKDFQVARAAVDTSADGKVAAVYGCYWMYGIGKGFEVIEFRDGLNPEKYTWSDIRREPADEITTRQVIALEGSEACFLTDKGLLFLDRNDRYNYYLVPFPKEIGLVNHMVKVGNRLLLVNQSEKIYQFDLTPDRRAFLPEEIRAYNLDEQAYIHNMKRIFLGRDSILWVSVEGRGVYYANLKNTRTFSVFRGDSMPPIPIEHIFEDFHGRIWSVSREKKNDAFRAWAFDMDNRLQDSTWLPGYFKAVQLPGGDVWAISTRGLGYQSKTGHQFNWLASLPELQSFPLYDIVTFDKAQLLLATEEGIYRYHTITGKLSRLKGVDGYVWKIFMDTRNRLWVNKSTGILTIWQFDPEKDDLNGLDTIRNVYGLNHMVEDTLRDVFWIATSRGLKKISDLTDHLHDNTDSFFEDDIRSVLIDPGHKLWLTTNRGVVRFDPDAERGEPITRFTDRDGISALEYTNGAALMARSGKLYFGSSGGMDCFDPGIDLIGAVPKLAIRNLFINNNTNEEWRDENGYP
ncbi:MAG: hypothetical protein KDD15_28790, partial [Lewinella sp.]|nr:hypothetical protein [Lewinella sp.]